MNKIIALIIAIILGLNLQAQDIQRDSNTVRYMDYIAKGMTKFVPRYKLYKTENIYNLIKLDTATGALWQVQYEMNNSASAMTVPINDKSLLWSSEEPIPGRFELYPTNNTYIFILLDTQTGTTYQVQWNTSPDKRFRILLH